jgi:hypothetical protein
MPLPGLKADRDFSCADIDGNGSDELLVSSTKRVITRKPRLVTYPRSLYSVNLSRQTTKIADLTQRMHILAADINSDGNAEIGLYADNSTELKFLDRAGATVATFTIPAAQQVVSAEAVAPDGSATVTPFAFIAGVDGVLYSLDLMSKEIRTLSDVNIQGARLIEKVNTWTPAP